MIRKRKSFTLLKLLWPILEDSSTRNPMSALSLPQTAEGREDLCKLGGPKVEACFFVFRATNQTQSLLWYQVLVSEQAAPSPHRVALRASLRFVGFVSSLSLTLSTTQWITTSFGSWDRRRPWPMVVLTYCYVIIKSHGDTHSLGPGRVVSSADTTAVDGRTSEVGGSVVVVGSGRGVVPTLLGDTDGDLIVSNFVEVTGAIGAGDSLWGPTVRGKQKRCFLNLF